MKSVLVAVCLGLSFVAPSSRAETRTICTLVVSATSGETIVNEGDCRQRMSPASTFKIAISLMGFDVGILKSPSEPELPFKEGYIDARPEWRRPATPASWMRDSVIWYSQQVTQRLGMQRYSAYVAAFAYGNNDLSGEPGKFNGLTHAWLSSSLQISPFEQVSFLLKLVRRELPVSEPAIENTTAMMNHGVQPSGWHVFGKTGAGARRSADGKLIGPFGWFVGWATRQGDTVVFARLIQDSERQASPPGFRARDALLSELFSQNGKLDYRKDANDAGTAGNSAHASGTSVRFPLRHRDHEPDASGRGQAYDSVKSQ